MNVTPKTSSFRMYLYGMSTDYTISNVSVSDIVEMDVYEYVFRKDTEAAFGIDEVSIKKWLADTQLAESVMPGASNGILQTDLGWVPTDCNTAMKNIVIQSKQRFYIGPGQACSFTKSINYKNPRVFTGTDFQRSEALGIADGVFQAISGVTRGILIVYKGLPSTTDASKPSQIAINAQTRYRVKRLDNEQNEMALGT